MDLLIAGPLTNGNLAATRIGGRIVNVGRMAGESGEFNFDVHSMRRITYVPRPSGFRFYHTALAQGALRLPIDKVLPLEEASEAFEHMARNQHFGKIVLANA